jgi:protein SCO1
MPYMMPGAAAMGGARKATMAALLVAGAVVLWVGLTTDMSRSGGETAVGETGFRGAVLPEPAPKPRFTLADTEGRPYDFVAETAGRLTLLFFGFTNCPDVCPVHLANIGAVLGDLPVDVRREIRVVFVSADPERDTPARMRGWLDSFDRNFVGLRGSVDEVNEILAELRLAPVSHGAPDARGNYTVGHPAQVLAFTPDGWLRVLYPFGTRQVDWAHDLPKLAGREFRRRADEAEPVSPDLKPGLAYVPEPAADGPAAAYLTVANRGTTADTLYGASTRVAASVELHLSALREGAMTMERVGAIGVAAGDSLRLEPGGYHLMLRELNTRLAAGDTFTVELRFRRGGRVPVHAVVVPYTALERMLGAGAGGHRGH